MSISVKRKAIVRLIIILAVIFVLTSSAEAATKKFKVLFIISPLVTSCAS